jgi:hypothetical protein
VNKFLEADKERIFPTHAIIIDTVKKLQNQNLNELYKQLLPRLIYNRNLFFEYAKHQQSNALPEL